MTQITISLPESAQAYIATQISSGQYATADEVLAALIEQAQEQADQVFNGPEQLKIQSRAQLDSLLLEGLASGESVEVTDDWWEAKRAKL
jgi:antitoxin ParD1/3/4